MCVCVCKTDISVADGREVKVMFPHIVVIGDVHACGETTSADTHRTLLDTRRAAHDRLFSVDFLNVVPLLLDGECGWSCPIAQPRTCERAVACAAFNLV